jgi:hypothetical protein
MWVGEGVSVYENHPSLMMEVCEVGSVVEIVHLPLWTS